MRQNPFRVAQLLVVALVAFPPGMVSAQGTDPDAAVAIVNGTPITLHEVNERALRVALRSENGVRWAQRDAARALIDERALADVAERRGITVETLHQQIDEDVWARFSPVTVEEAREHFFNNTRSGLTFEQVQGAIQRELDLRNYDRAYEAYVDSLTGRLVAITLPTPDEAVAIPASTPVRGPRDAAVRVVVFADFQGVSSARHASTIDQVRETYGDRVVIAFRHFPHPGFPEAHQAAQAAQCAHDQGQFWPYHDRLNHDRLYANQWTLGVESLKQHAADLGLDTARFDACLDDETQRSKVDADLADGERVGVPVHPSTFVNGMVMAGELDFGDLKPLIDDELARRSSQ